MTSSGSNKSAFRSLRNFFGPHDRPTESAIGKIVMKFQETGSVADVKKPIRARAGRSAENIAAVREDVAESPNTSIRRRAQQLQLSATTLHRILKKDLSLHAYKIQLSKNLSQQTVVFPIGYTKKDKWITSFPPKSFSATKPISISVAMSTSRIEEYGLMKIQGQLSKHQCIHKK